MESNLSYKRVEIGFTFLAKSSQRTRVNTEAKLLMLTHAFEVMNLNRVVFLTDYLNTKSRNAILRLGEKRRRDFTKPHDYARWSSQRLSYI